MIESSPAAPPSTDVLVVADEMLVRAGLRAVIDSDPGLHVVAEAADGDHALDTAARIWPGLAIIGSHGPTLDSIDVTRRMRAVSPQTTIVVLARLDDGEALLGALRAGALGVLRTGVERLELLNGLHRALAGESVVDPTVANALIARMASESDLPPRALPEPLTPRETEILRLVARGQTNREIAARLIVAVGTIKVHVEHILDKLGVSDRTQAAVLAVELGIARRDDPGAPTDPGR